MLPCSFSMAAYELQGRVEEKRKGLSERRERLASLLAKEREMYEVSLLVQRLYCKLFVMV